LGGKPVRIEVFRVQGMSCMHCKAAIEKALQALPGVAEAEVDLEGAAVRVVFEETAVTVEQMREAIEEVGYTVTA
jgi:copper ion binding protein